MNSSNRIAMLVLAILVFACSITCTNAQLPQVDVPCLSTPVVLDGTITGEEWSDAAMLSTYFHFYNYSADPIEYIGNQSATLYFKHDPNNLWVCISLEDAIENTTVWDTYPTGMPTILGDSLWIFYDVSGDMGIGSGDDEKGMIHPDFTYDAALIPALPGYDKDTNLGGTTDIDGASGWAAGWLTYEMTHPLNSGDVVGNDPALGPGDSIVTQFVVMDPEFGNTSQIYAWTSYYELVITPCPVGGVIMPIHRFEVLAPILGIGAAIAVAIAALKKRPA